MPEPFVAYLRVYEPLPAFEETARNRLVWAAKRAVKPLSVGHLEQKMWLSTQLAAPPQILPTSSGDGSAGDNWNVLVIQPNDVPTTSSSGTVGPGPLVCPLDLRGRSAAALVGFLSTAEPSLASAALPGSVETAHARAAAVVSELSSGAVHVLSSTWTVPLPWFVVVDPQARRITVDKDGTPRRVCWQTAMADARRRVARAHSVAASSIGDEGPTKILRETARWLERFHPHSAVELDYGGLVQMMSEATIEADTSAEDVHAIVDAMEGQEPEEVAERYEALQDFWGELAARERYN